MGWDGCFHDSKFGVVILVPRKRDFARGYFGRHPKSSESFEQENDVSFKDSVKEAQLNDSNFEYLYSEGFEQGVVLIATLVFLFPKTKVAV